MARFPFRIGYCGKPACHTGVSHLLRLLVMQTCLWLSYHMAPTAVNISPTSFLYLFTRSCYVFSALAKKPPPPSRESRWDPPAHLWSARTGSRPAALWRLINSNFVPNTVLAPTFLLPNSAGGAGLRPPPLVVDVLLVGAQLSILVPTPWLVGWYVPFVAPVQPVRISLGWLK